MRIVAVSDTHVRKFDELPEKLVSIMDSANMVIHAGDFMSSDVLEEFERRYDFIGVFGNVDDCEVKKRLNETEIFEADSLRFGITHKGNFLNEFHDLGYKAMEMNVDVLVFGHIHRFIVEKIGRVILICPGSPKQPRMSASSCAVIDVENGKLDVNFELVEDFACGIDMKLREMVE